MTQPTDDQLAAAAQKARADHETAREIAARLLAPPDPVDILAGVIADRGEVADERDELQAKCDALTADLVAIRGIVGRHGAPIAEAVRQIRDELIRERDLARADRDAARKSTREAYAIASDGLREIACALGLPADQAAIADLVAKVGDLSSSLSTAEKDAEIQRTAAADLRAALDRVAMATDEKKPDPAAAKLKKELTKKAKAIEWTRDGDALVTVKDAIDGKVATVEQTGADEWGWWVHVDAQGGAEIASGTAASIDAAKAAAIKAAN